MVAVELYGQGFKTADIARRLLDHLVPDNGIRTEPQRLKTARQKLRQWQKAQKFRDALYHQAVVKTDLQVPQILDGVTARAIEGNVDAAKFAMEQAGRYTPKGDLQPAAVTVVFNSLPRPLRREEKPAIEGEAVEIESEP